MLNDLQRELNQPTTKKSATVFVDYITKLLESVAQVVELYHPLVETYYGSGHLMLFVNYIQTECDRQGVRMIESFVKNRRFSERAKQIDLLIRKTNKSSVGGVQAV